MGDLCGCCLTEEGAPVFGIRALQLSVQAEASRRQYTPPSSSSTTSAGASSRKRAAGSAAGGGPAHQQSSSSQGGDRSSKRAKPGPAADDSFSFPVLRAASEQLHFERSSRPALDACRSLQLQVAAGGARLGSAPKPGVEPIDPLLLHRPFCPWVNAAQEGGESSSSPPGKCQRHVSPVLSPSMPTRDGCPTSWAPSEQAAAVP